MQALFLSLCGSRHGLGGRTGSRRHSGAVRTRSRNDLRDTDGGHRNEARLGRRRNRNRTLDAYLNIAAFQLELGNVLFFQKLYEFFQLFLIHSNGGGTAKNSALTKCRSFLWWWV